MTKALRSPPRSSNNIPIYYDTISILHMVVQDKLNSWLLQFNISLSGLKHNQYLGIQNKFTSVEHPQANGQAESANKIILSGLKKKLDDAKEAWAEQLCQVIWSYHTTPNSSTGEMPFKLAFGSDAMIPVELGHPSFRRENTNVATNVNNLNASPDLLDETCEITHLREFAITASS